MLKNIDQVICRPSLSLVLFLLSAGGAGLPVKHESEPRQGPHFFLE